MDGDEGGVHCGGQQRSGIAGVVWTVVWTTIAPKRPNLIIRSKRGDVVGRPGDEGARAGQIVSGSKVGREHVGRTVAHGCE